MGSWEADARIADKQAGHYFDPAKVHRVDHTGPYVKTAGPLNVPRSPQGRPVLAQAGASEAGRAFSAGRADIVFTVQSTLSGAQDFYADMKARAARAGRDPDTILVLPAIVPVTGATRQGAEDRLREMNGFAVIEHVLAKLSEFLGADLSGVDLDSPLPPTPLNTASPQCACGRAELITRFEKARDSAATWSQADMGRKTKGLNTTLLK